MASVRSDDVFSFYCWLWCAFYRSELSPRLSLASTTKQKVNFTFDLATYFLFLVRELASYQDGAKCQDGGCAKACGLPGPHDIRELEDSVFVLFRFHVFF